MRADSSLIVNFLLCKTPEANSRTTNYTNTVLCISLNPCLRAHNSVSFVWTLCPLLFFPQLSKKNEAADFADKEGSEWLKTDFICVCDWPVIYLIPSSRWPAVECAASNLIEKKDCNIHLRLDRVDFIWSALQTYYLINKLQAQSLRPFHTHNLKVGGWV